MLSFTKNIHFGKNPICKFFFVLSSVSFVPLLRLKEYMCLTEITLNLSVCQLFSYTFHWTKINSLSWPFPAKSTFRLLFFKQFRVSSFQKSMIGLDMKYFKFHYLQCRQLQNRIGHDGFGYFYHLVKIALAIRWNILLHKFFDRQWLYM